jgi:hypothetical protein
VLSLEHQAIADRLHEETRCWTWRSHLLAERIAELGIVEHKTERALCAAGARFVSLLPARKLIDRAYRLWTYDKYDYCEAACEQLELALIGLRRAARQAGAL